MSSWKKKKERIKPDAVLEFALVDEGDCVAKDLIAEMVIHQPTRFYHHFLATDYDFSFF